MFTSSTASALDKHNAEKELFIKKRMQDFDFLYLKQLGYTDKKIRPVLAQEYNGSREPNSYITDNVLKKAKEYRIVKELELSNKNNKKSYT